MDKQIIDFLKGLMQPLITVGMIVVFISFSLAGKFTGDQVWQVVVGVIVFWFGYTAFKFGTGGNTDTSKDLGTVAKIQASALDNANSALSYSVPADIVKPSGAIIPTVTTTNSASTANVSNSDEPSLEDALADADKQAKAGL